MIAKIIARVIARMIARMIARLLAIMIARMIARMMANMKIELLALWNAEMNDCYCSSPTDEYTGETVRGALT
jgi:hypothetical protein